MRLSIVGCPDKERFRPFVKKAIQFYAQQLMTPKMLENISVKVKFNKKLDVYGYAGVTDYNDSNKPREFEIEIHPGIGAHDILETLAHEMVHVKQYAYSEMNESATRWRGNKISLKNVDYYNEPWEIEAYGMAVGLFTKLVIKEKLHQVFGDISDPEAPLDYMPILWMDNQPSDVALLQKNNNLVNISETA
jgi:hypothetical protein